MVGQLGVQHSMTIAPCFKPDLQYWSCKLEHRLMCLLVYSCQTCVCSPWLYFVSATLAIKMSLGRSIIWDGGAQLQGWQVAA